MRMAMSGAYRKNSLGNWLLLWTAVSKISQEEILTYEGKVSSISLTEEEKTLILKYRHLPVFVQNTIKEMCDCPE